MVELLEVATSGFWRFIGSLIILSVVAGVVVTVASYVFRCWNRLMRHLNVKRHGWPPEHLDADGNFRPNIRT